MEGVKYLVMSLKPSIDVTVYGQTQTIPLSYIEGQIGAIPVFEDWQAAKAYAGEKFEIVPINICTSPNTTTPNSTK